MVPEQIRKYDNRKYKYNIFAIIVFAILGVNQKDKAAISRLENRCFVTIRYNIAVINFETYII